MRVALVTYIKDDFIPRKIKHIVQSDGELHHSEIGRKVPAVAYDRIFYFAAELFTQTGEFLYAHFSERMPV